MQERMLIYWKMNMSKNEWWWIETAVICYYHPYLVWFSDKFIEINEQYSSGCHCPITSGIPWGKHQYLVIFSLKLFLMMFMLVHKHLCLSLLNSL